MKKILLILLLVIGLPVMAEEAANQEVVIDANKATPILVKQPANPQSFQKVTITNNWFSPIFIVNGKVPFESNKGDN